MRFARVVQRCSAHAGLLTYDCRQFGVAVIEAEGHSVASLLAGDETRRGVAKLPELSTR